MGATTALVQVKLHEVDPLAVCNDGGEASYYLAEARQVSACQRPSIRWAMIGLMGNVGCLLMGPVI